MVGRRSDSFNRAFLEAVVKFHLGWGDNIFIPIILSLFTSSSSLVGSFVTECLLVTLDIVRLKFLVTAFILCPRSFFLKKNQTEMNS